MKICTLNRLVAILFFLICANARADDANVDIMKKLYSKIAEVVGIGNPQIAAGNEFLVLANPGILIDPKLSMKKAEDRYKLSIVLDKVLIPDFIYKTRNERTIDIYKAVLDYHEAPTYKLPVEAQAQLDKARKDIFVDGERKKGFSDDYNTFVAKRTAFALANDAVTQYKSLHPDEAVPESLFDALDIATGQYELIGQRYTFIADQAVIRQWEHLDPQVYWGALNEQFIKNTDVRNGVNVAVYDLYPTYDTWLDTTKDWWHEGFTETQLTQTTHNSQSSVGGGFGVSFGLWSVGADYNHQENRTYFKLDVSGYTVTFELLRVDLNRPWMDATVFQSNAWKWLSTYPDISKHALLSNGGDALNGAAIDGKMPFLPSALLLARNVTITGNWGSDLNTTFDQHTSGGASIGWGCFSLGGRFDNADQNTYTRAQAAGNTITFKDAQIFGFFCEVLPKNPDPDPELHFPSDVHHLGLFDLPFVQTALEKEKSRVEHAQALLLQLKKAAGQ
jgi:hypothetical protein